MMPSCPPPDFDAGTVVRMSDFMTCEGRVLGENGFQAFAGGAIGVSLLSGLLTIFIGLIGYRLILGETPDIRNGVTWAARVGIVLALVTSWPAFQTLAFRVAVDGPDELASTILPASGVPAEELSLRVQRAYDTLRLGSSFQTTGNLTAAGKNSQSSNAAVAQATLYQSASPQTASLFVLSTTGMIGAFHIAIGFLLAIAPLPLMALLFDSTLGIFVGWVRALAGSALASLSAIIVTATHLLAVESELAHLQSIRLGGAERMVDPQGLTTIVLIFAITVLATSFAAMRIASAFHFEGLSKRFRDIEPSPIERLAHSSLLVRHPESAVAFNADQVSRAASVADALSATIRREAAGAAGTAFISARPSASDAPVTSRSDADNSMVRGLGSTSRRIVSRRTRSATKRDRAGQ